MGVTCCHEEVIVRRGVDDCGEENYRKDYENVKGFEEFRRVYVRAMFDCEEEYVLIGYEIGHKIEYEAGGKKKTGTSGTTFGFPPIPIEKLPKYKNPCIPEDLLKEALEKHMSKRIKIAEQDVKKSKESKYLEKLNQILQDTQ